METHDPVLSKLGAGREKDIDFARSAAGPRLQARAGAQPAGACLQP
jgi:hypothetical protein